MNEEKDNKRTAGFLIREYRKLTGYAARILGEASDMDPEDFVQDLAITILSKPDVGAPVGNAAAYIYRSFKNKIIDYFRKKKINTVSENPADEISLTDIIAEIKEETHSSVHADMKTALAEAMNSLSPEERSVITATEIEGLQFKELSQQWGVPLGTLLSYKSRGMKKLRSHFHDIFNSDEETDNGTY